MKVRLWLIASCLPFLLQVSVWAANAAVALEAKINTYPQKIKRGQAVLVHLTVTNRSKVPFRKRWFGALPFPVAVKSPNQEPKTPPRTIRPWTKKDILEMRVNSIGVLRIQPEGQAVFSFWLGFEDTSGDAKTVDCVFRDPGTYTISILGSSATVQVEDGESWMQDVNLANRLMSAGNMPNAAGAKLADQVLQKYSDEYNRTLALLFVGRTGDALSEAKTPELRQAVLLHGAHLGVLGERPKYAAMLAKKSASSGDSSASTTTNAQPPDGAISVAFEAAEGIPAPISRLGEQLVGAQNKGDVVAILALYDWVAAKQLNISRANQEALWTIRLNGLRGKRVRFRMTGIESPSDEDDLPKGLATELKKVVCVSEIKGSPPQTTKLFVRSGKDEAYIIGTPLQSNFSRRDQRIWTEFSREMARMFGQVSVLNPVADGAPRQVSLSRLILQELGMDADAQKKVNIGQEFRESAMLGPKYNTPGVILALKITPIDKDAPHAPKARQQLVVLVFQIQPPRPSLVYCKPIDDVMKWDWRSVDVEKLSPIELRD